MMKRTVSQREEQLTPSESVKELLERKKIADKKTMERPFEEFRNLFMHLAEFKRTRSSLTLGVIREEVLSDEGIA